MRLRGFVVAVLGSLCAGLLLLMTIPGLAQIVVRDTLLLAVTTVDEVRATDTAGAQTVATSTVFTVAFPQEIDANASMHSTSTNNSRITIPWAAKCTVSASVALSGTFSTSANAQLAAKLVLNSGTTNLDLATQEYWFQSGDSFTNIVWQATPTVTRAFAANDYVELVIYQATGSSMTVASGSGNESNASLGAICLH